MNLLWKRKWKNERAEQFRYEISHLEISSIDWHFTFCQMQGNIHNDFIDHLNQANSNRKMFFITMYIKRRWLVLWPDHWPDPHRNYGYKTSYHLKISCWINWDWCSWMVIIIIFCLFKCPLKLSKKCLLLLGINLVKV